MAQAQNRTATLMRLVREALAIFLGVAAALAGQAWFERGADRRAEREYLESVLEELATLEQANEALESFFEGQRQIAVEIATLLAQPVSDLRADSVLRLAPQLGRYLPGEALGSMDALLAPEPLQAVQDAGLRSSLAGFRTIVLWTRTVMDQNRDFILDTWMEFGLTHFDLRTGGFWAQEPEAPPPTRHVRDGTTLIESPVFENLIDSHVAHYRNVLGSSDALTNGINRARDATEARLGEL